MSDDKIDPAHLTEGPETGDRFLVYGTEKGLRLDIRYEAARGAYWPRSFKLTYR